VKVSHLEVVSELLRDPKSESRRTSTHWVKWKLLPPPSPVSGLGPMIRSDKKRYDTKSTEVSKYYFYDVNIHTHMLS